MSGQELSELHLAELHARAAERGIEGYRLLRREELIERLSEEEDEGRGWRFGRRRRRGGDDEGAQTIVAPSADEPARVETEEAEEEEREERAARRRRRGRRGRERERLAPEPTDEEAEAEEAEEGREEAEAEEVVGVLELTRQRHGFLRGDGLAARDDDVYVSASQVRRCELRPGDVVRGPARAPRRGERHRALIHVDQVNGGEPQEEGRPDFDSFTPVPPTRRIRIGYGADPLVRAIDKLVPLAYGQRVLVRAAPRSGRTTVLRALAKELAATGADIEVLLIDERPEEVPAWREAVPNATFALAPADLPPREQVRVAELALERARRQVEAGRDVILICDSLSRLSVAAGGVAEVKRLFGSGRELAEEDAGSLTVIATVFAIGEDGGEAERAVITTENALITLDPELAAQGAEPPLRVAECHAKGEDALLDSFALSSLRDLRRELAELDPAAAVRRLRERA